MKVHYIRMLTSSLVVGLAAGLTHPAHAQEGHQATELANHDYFTSSLQAAAASFIQFKQPREIGITVGYNF